MKKILPLIVLAFYATSIFAQFHQGKIKQKDYLQKIPYQKIQGVVIVPVTINGNVYRFAFDTGATTFAISDKICKELNLEVIRQINAVDASGETDKIRFVLLPEIDLQGITFQNIPGVIFPEKSETTKFAECFGVDGVVGSNMLRNSVVQFDEQNKQIIIANDIKSVMPQQNGCKKVKLSCKKSAPYFKITLQKGAHKAVYSVLFDTGDSDGFFTLALNKLNSRVANIIAESEGSFSMGVHGVYKKQKHILLSVPNIEIGVTTFNNVIVTTTNSSHSRIGTKLLEYGKVTLDYKRKHFYFEPLDSINTNKPVENPLTFYSTVQNEKIVVGHIWDKQLEAQLNLGDEVLSINGIDIQSKNLCELFRLEIPSNDNNIWELRDIHTGAIKTIEIKRMQLIKE